MAISREIASLFYSVRAKTEGFDSDLKGVERSAEKLANFIKKNPVAAAGALGTALIGVGIEAAKMAEEVEKSFNQIERAVPGAIGATGALRQQIRELSLEQGRSQTELAQAAAEVARQGVGSIEEVGQRLNAAVRAADATGGDINAIIGGLDQVLDLFGKSSRESEAVMQRLYAVSHGRLPMQDLLDALYTAAPTIKNLGIDFDTAAAALGGLVDRGYKTKAAAAELKALGEQGKEGAVQIEKLAVAFGKSKDASAEYEHSIATARESTESLWKMTKNNLAAVMIDLGNLILPKVTYALKVLDGLLATVNGTMDKMSAGTFATTLIQLGRDSGKIKETADQMARLAEAAKAVRDAFKGGHFDPSTLSAEEARSMRAGIGLAQKAEPGSAQSYNELVRQLNVVIEKEKQLGKVKTDTSIKTAKQLKDEADLRDKLAKEEEEANKKKLAAFEKEKELRKDIAALLGDTADVLNRVEKSPFDELLKRLAEAEERLLDAGKGVEANYVAEARARVEEMKRYAGEAKTIADGITAQKEADDAMDDWAKRAKAEGDAEAKRNAQASKDQEALSLATATRIQSAFQTMYENIRQSGKFAFGDILNFVSSALPAGSPLAIGAGFLAPLVDGILSDGERVREAARQFRAALKEWNASLDEWVQSMTSATDTLSVALRAAFDRYRDELDRLIELEKMDPKRGGAVGRVTGALADLGVVDHTDQFTQSLQELNEALALAVRRAFELSTAEKMRTYMSIMERTAAARGDEDAVRQIRRATELAGAHDLLERAMLEGLYATEDAARAQAELKKQEEDAANELKAQQALEAQILRLRGDNAGALEIERQLQLAAAGSDAQRELMKVIFGLQDVGRAADEAAQQLADAISQLETSFEVYATDAAGQAKGYGTQFGFDLGDLSSQAGVDAAIAQLEALYEANKDDPTKVDAIRRTLRALRQIRFDASGPSDAGSGAEGSAGRASSTSSVGGLAGLSYVHGDTITSLMRQLVQYAAQEYALAREQLEAYRNYSMGSVGFGGGGNIVNIQAGAIQLFITVAAGADTRAVESAAHRGIDAALSAIRTRLRSAAGAPRLA